MTPVNKSDILTSLKTDILRLQGFKPVSNSTLDVGLQSMSEAFPNRVFPIGQIHEFLCANTEGTATSAGFIAGLLSLLLKKNGAILWISAARKLFPPALKFFGLNPERFIFIDLQKEKDVRWAMDEALKCAAITAVVGELKALSFSESRRLQLAVEQSRVTGFVLRQQEMKNGTTACVSRWRITSIPSSIPEELPGIGFPAWHVELLRMRNGKTGSWNIQWKNGLFSPFHIANPIVEEEKRKAG